jgi:hypothetical protein
VVLVVVLIVGLIVVLIVVLTVALTLVPDVIVLESLLPTSLDLKKDLVDPHLTGTKLDHPLHLPPVFLHRLSPHLNRTLPQVTSLLKIKKRSVLITCRFRNLANSLQKFMVCQESF